jgi:nucleotide-binding universal stress UspA family protein
VYKKILIAYDGSAHSQRALDCAQDLAQRYAAQLILVHAFHPIPKEWGSPLLEEAEAHAIREGKKIIQEAQSKLGGTSLQVVTEVLEGPPAGAILRVAETRECDLIVMGSRGLGELTAVLLGSVSERVVHHSTIPVLIVK